MQPRIAVAADRVLAFAVVGLVGGSVLCFGGAVWWFRPAAAVLTFVLAAAALVQLLYQGRMPVLKSPLTLLGFLAIGLAALQLFPLPAGLARRLSPVAQQIYSYGVIPDLVRADLPTIELPEPAQVRSPATLDRAATLRWLVGALICLGVFWSVSHYADRLGRVYLVWGSLVGAFLFNAALGMVQIAGHAEGLYGFVHPGRAALWAPSASDLLESPSATVLRPLLDPAASADPSRATDLPVVRIPEEPFCFGTMVPSSGAFLAFGSLALPLSLAIVIHLLAPRGSRETLASRLGQKGQGSLIVLMVIMLVSSALLVGLVAGPWFSLPFFVGLAAVGLPSAAGWRWPRLGLTALLAASLGLGAGLSAIWPGFVGGTPPIAPPSWQSARLVWNETAPILRNFPLVGTGMGSFESVYPYLKAQDAASATASSSFLQCAVESGAIGLGLLAAAGLWSLCRLPACLRRVGTADRTLAYGLIGAALGFTLWSVVHWAVELPAVAISASALGGTWNRWLAGGTDLFVERG
jgi:hypothetical protein